MMQKDVEGVFDADACRAWYDDKAKKQREALRQSCCSPLPPRYLVDLLNGMDAGWFSDFGGYGYPLPPAIGGCRVAVVGCDTGRDALLAALLTGLDGSVVGVDWRRERLEQATRMTVRQAIPGKLEYWLGYPELLLDGGMKFGTFDLVVANCMLSGTYDRLRVFSQLARFLKPGGELMLTDIVCTSGAESGFVGGHGYFGKGDLETCAEKTGWRSLRVISREDVYLDDVREDQPVGTYELVCARAFPGVWEGPGTRDGADISGKPDAQGKGECSDGVPSAVLTYAKPIPENKRYFDFDEDHRFILGHPKCVDDGTAFLLMDSRYGRYFTCEREG